jgi:hypothetical protein
LVLTAKPGLGSDMSQTKQQQGAAAAKPGARKDWELFWRIIAGLMLLVIAWVVWVLYQITPRSVVTPLAYANQTRPIGGPQSAIGTVAPAAPRLAPTRPAPQPAAEATAADVAMDQAQAAMRAGAHQASADVQAAAANTKEQQIKGEGLRLATEISTPLAEKQTILKTQEGKPEAAPATGAAGKDRP